MAKRANLDTDDLKVCRQAFFDFGVEKDEHIVSIGLAAELSGAMPSLEACLDLLPLQPDCEWISPDGVKPEQRISVEAIDRNWRDRVLNSLPGFFRAVDKMPAACRLSPGVEVFRELHNELPVDGYPDLFRAFCQNPYAHKRFDYFREFADYVNNFMSALRRRLCSAVVRRRISDWRRSADRNCLEYCSYVRKLFEVTARLVVIRLDLGYRKDSQVDFETAINDLDRFFANRRHNPKLFHARRGYIAKVEYGMDHGYHFHLLLFFDGSKRLNQSDVYLAKEIGEYWQNVIAPGRGRYWNSNARKQDFQFLGRLGIGTIHVSDKDKIENLVHIVRYFCKKEQFCKPLASPKTKLLRKGKTPKLPQIKQGRPRSVDARIYLSC